MREDYCVPLLISEKIGIDEHIYAFIGDRLFFYYPYYESSTNPISSYNSLLFLYKHLKKEKAIPAELQKYFQRKKPILDEKLINQGIEIQEQKYNSFHLVGFFGGIDSYHLKYSLEINDKRKKSIQVINCSIHKHDFDSDQDSIEQTIQHCLSMTPTEAFILFANNSVSYFDTHAVLRNSNMEQKEKDTPNMENQLRIIYYFSKDYLEWLIRNFESGEINPEMVLKWNGYETLNHLLDIPAVQDLLWETFRKIQNYKNLSNLELILYYTFYNKARYKKYFDILQRWGKIANELESTKKIPFDEEMKIGERLAKIKDEGLQY